MKIGGYNLSVPCRAVPCRAVPCRAVPQDSSAFSGCQSLSVHYR